MNLASLEMLTTLETLADKLSSSQPNSNKILLDNNGNKVNCAISRADKIQQHPYQKDYSHHNNNNNNSTSNNNHNHRSSPNSHNSNGKYNEK
jgi:hypothetical protein